MSVYSKLQKVRVEMLDSKIEKTGINKYADFKYFEIGDFIGLSNRLMNKHGLCPVFNLTNDRASLVIYETEGEGKISFYTPIDVAMNGKVTPIQDIGARHTYAKRYLYLNALELEENDPVNATIGKDNGEVNEIKKGVKSQEKEVKTGKPEIKSKATTKQLEILVDLYTREEVQAIQSHFKIEALSELTVIQASKLIERKKAKGKA